MNYNELAKRAHENAVKHGFWDEEYSVEHYLMLVITEIGELVQADRKGKVMEIGSPAAQKLMENDMEDGATFEEFFPDFVNASPKNHLRIEERCVCVVP